MKTSLLFLLLAGTLPSGAATWEWTFDSDTPAAALGDGTLAWSTEAARSLAAFETSDGVIIPHPGGSAAGYLRLPAYTNPADYPQFSFGGSAGNGGGLYINQYTMVMDVYIPGTHNWLPLFNTNPANGNDADFYVAPDGSLGIGSLGYSPAGSVSTDAWHRIAFAADLNAGNVSYYLDGTLIFQRVGESLVDGRFSLYSALDEGPDLILGNEGDDSGIYTRDWLLASFAFTDRTLSADEITSLGSPAAPGIFITTTPPGTAPQLLIKPDAGGITVDWDQTGFVLQRSTDLSTWISVPGSTTTKTHTEAPGSIRAFFRLAAP